MFEQLMDLVKQNSQEAIVNNPAVPNEQNDAVVQTASSSIMSTLQGLLSSGGASSVLNLFNQNNQADISNHPVTQTASSNLISTLMSKFGISSDKAGGIASMLLPMVMSKLVSKTNDSNDNSFNIQGIFNSLSGGKTGGMDIGSLVSQFGGNALDKNHDGKVDLSDLTAAFSGGGDNTQQANTTQNSGGGIMDTISGLFGKS
jgi:Ca2+-binding EF-hand superfamily protein